MDLIKFIIIVTMLVMLCGCCVLAHEAEIKNYLEGSNIQKYGTYDLHVIDKNDVNYAKLLFPIDDSKLIVQDNGFGPDSQMATQYTLAQPWLSTQPYVPNPNSNYNQPIQSNQYNQSNQNQPDRSNQSKTSTKTQINSNGLKGTRADPNRTFGDTDLLPSMDNNKDFGNELPWDREIGFCEVLKGSDRDLYSNVIDNTIVTFF